MGYTLGQIDVPLNGISTGDTVYLKIYNDTSGAPDTLKHTFTAPNPFPAGTTVKVTFTAPTDATLNANTTYWMAIERNTGALEVSNTTSNEERGLSDWSIGNTEIKSTANNWDTITSFSQALRFTVWGRVNDEDTTGPSLQADNSHVNPAGDQVILQFNEDIDEDTADLPPINAFTVKADGETVLLENMEVSDSRDDQIKLNLASEAKIYEGQTVTVSYADPSTDDDTAALQDTSGGDADSFTDEEIQNESALIENLLVTNTGETKHGDRAVDSSDQGFASSFTTGDEPNGYILQDVQIQMGSFDSGDAVIVQLYSDAGEDKPAYSEILLSNPGTLPSTDDQTAVFTAPAGTILSTSAKYWLTVERTSGSFTIARADGDDQTGQTGWEIGNNTRQRGTGTWSNASSSNKHLTFTIRGEANDQEDTTGPSLQADNSKVNANGNQVILRFHEDIDEDTADLPPISAFTVRADGQTLLLEDTDIASSRDDEIKLNLASGELIYRGQTVTVSYQDPTSGDDSAALQNPDGDDAESFTDEEIPNLSTQIQNALVHNITTEKVNDRTMTINGPGFASSFTTGDGPGGYVLNDVQIRMGGLTSGDDFNVRIYSDSSSGPDDIEYTLTNPTPLPSGGDVTVEFQAPADSLLEPGTKYWVAVDWVAGLFTTAITASDDQTGETGWSIDNNSRFWTTGGWSNSNTMNRVLMFAVRGEISGDTTGPALVGGRSFAVRHGEEVDLTFNEDIDQDTANLPPVGAFIIKADGRNLSLLDLNISADDRIIVNLGPGEQIYQGQTVTVSYTDPTSGDDSAAIQDTSGNDAESFTDMEIHNLSRQIEHLLVTNTGEADHGDRAVDSSDTGFASSFTTGDEPGGYVLMDVLIQMGGFDSADDVVVKLYSNSSNRPDDILYTLANPASLPSDDDQTVEFAAPTGSILDPETKYWVTVERVTGSFTIARADGDGQTGETGWEIGDTTRQKGAGSWNDASSSDKHLTFTVRGAVSTGGRALWSATLTVGTDTGTGCTGAIPGTVGTLSDDDFDHDSTEYDISRICIMNNQLVLGLDPSGASVFNSQDFTLQIGEETFNFADAPVDTNDRFIWYSPSLTWQDNAEVSLRIVHDDITGPTLVADTTVVDVSGEITYIRFDEPLDRATGAEPPISAFTLTANGRDIPLDSFYIPTSEPSLLALIHQRGQRVYAGETLRLNYQDPTSGDDEQALQDPSGNDVESFSNVEIDNLSEADSPGTISISSAQSTIREGDEGNPGPQTVTWTLWATTDYDLEPRAGFELEVSVRSFPGSAGSDIDYELYSETYFLRNTDFTRQRVPADSNTFRYTATITGTVTILDDQIVEEDEDMVIRAIPTLTAWPFTHDLTVTITDQDTFGLRLEANQEYALQGRNNDINLTWKVLTGDGQEADSCTVPFIFDAATAVGGTAGTSDYSHTVRTGSLEPSFSACENTESTTVRITTTDTARQDRTITFNPSVDHARFDSRLTERAVITLRDNAPPSVRNISIQRRDSALDLTWNSQAHATGYTVQWKSGSEEYSSSREADVAGGENRKYSITGLDNATEYTLRARARDDRGNGPWSSERRGTPSNLHALVSNLNRSGTRNKDVGATSGTIRSWAQKFTTGPATAYHLENVVLRLKEVDSNDTPVVRIHAHGTVDETPRRARYTLITPDGLTVGSTAENITFKAPPDAFLVGNTTYWIVVTDTSSDHDLIGTNSNAEDAENGWSIGDESIRRNRSNPWDKNNDYNSSFRMAVNGSAADPTPQTVWEATLTVGEAADVPDGNLEREFGYREGNYRVDADGNTRGRHGIGSLTVHRIQNGWEYTVIESLLQFELGGVQIQGNRNSKAQYLAFATNMELPPGSTLVIGDQEYELNGKNSYDRYGIDDITWRAGDRINLAVRIPAFARLKPVTASFGNATHYAGERGQKAVVEVRLSEAPERTLTIPLTYTNEGGARDADHQGIPESVTFGPEDTTQTFEVTAVADESWKENKRERVSISLGQMPTGVRVGNQDTTDVFLIDAVLEVWMEFPEDPWVTEGDGKIKVDFVARSREHNRTTGQFSAAAVLFAADGTNNTSAQITGHFAAATQNDDYTRFSEAVRYNEPRWEWDPQCNCSTFRKPYEISIINDDAAEPVEEVAIRIILGGRPDSYTSRDTLEQSNIDRYNFFIIDDDSDKPVISLEAVRDSVTEGTAIGITLNTDKLTTRNVPVKLKVSEDGNTLTADGTLDFTIPLGVTEHTVYLSTVNDDVRENASTVKVEVHTNKNDDGQQYHVGPPRTVRVQVQDNEVESSPPGTPQRVSAIAGNRTVTLSWDAPLELGDARLRRYEVQDITAGAGPWTNVGTRTSHTFRNLTNGTFLVFRVRAVSDSGNGTPSYPAAATPTSQTNPEAPQGLAADGYDGRVFLSWAQPVHNGGSAIRRYEYRYAESRETAQPAYNSWRSTGSAETNHTVRGLTNGQPYNFQVRAVNSSGRESHAATVSNVAPRQSVEPLTVAVDDPPANHGGGKFTVTLRFSHLLATSLDTIKAGRPANTSLNVFDYNDRTPFIQVTGGRIAYITKELEKVQITGDLSDEEIQARWNNQDDLYHITIMPASHEPVTLSMQGGSVGRTCHHYAHICNSYEDHLSNSIEHIIAGPKQLTVSDASAREGTDSTMSFTVRLSGPAAAEVKVRWQTQDLTAMSTTDYEGDSGTVTFAPGETTKTVTIGIRDDSSAEGAEDFRLLLTSATGAVISDGIGVGRINDNE